MMKRVRNLVFETNSSSTHSLTIRRLSEDKRTIPYDSKLNICEEVDYQSSDTIMNEMDKLRYMVQMIALQMDYESSNDYFGTETYRYWGEKAKEGWKKYKKNILAFPWLVWLCEIVKEERNTTLIFEGKYNNDFPYISDFSSFDDEYPFEAIGLNKKNVYDEKTVKDLFRDIIFNPNVILEDKNEEY